MPLRFAANISTLFTEVGGLASRYKAARECGFSAVECQFPYSSNHDDLVKAKEKEGLEHVLINSYPGNPDVGEFGFATVPHYGEKFKCSLDLTLKYAKALECKRVHVIAGLMSTEDSNKALEETYVNNLKYAAELFKKNGVIGLIEPLCEAVKPHYFLSNFQNAIEYVKLVDSPHLRLQLDIFHLQMIHGNLTNYIKTALPYTGHVQIAQAPNRFEPGVSGEINYRYIFSLLDDLGYDGWIGLEYFPSAGNSKQSLQWMEDFGISLS